MSIELRPYHPRDSEALLRICLRTGDAGRDATHLYRDPRLLGLFYALPYVACDPRLCIVASVHGEASGYILGTDNSQAFRNWTEENWFPELRARYPKPAENDASLDAIVIRLIHAGYDAHPDTLAYPGHLHIDLLPGLQGKGLGRRMMEEFLSLLRGRGCPAVHLGVSENNTGGIAFYEKTGFNCLGRYPGWRAYGRSLAAPAA